MEVSIQGPTGIGQQGPATAKTAAAGPAAAQGTGVIVPLPHNEYFGATKLGEGAFGAVVLVYNDDGTEFAAKVFEDEEEDEDDEAEYDSDGDEIEAESWSGGTGLPVEVVRELSMLQLLNGAHPNVMRMIDASMVEYEGTPTFSMVMAKAAGALSGAIEGKSLKGSAKVRVAGLLLHALDWMAGQSIMHRDIKPDNILLTTANDPVICDFSLAKVVYAASDMAEAEGSKKKKKGKKDKKKAKQQVGEADGKQHSEGAGTPTYIAPEIVNGAVSYGTQVDVWSMGVVFYEMFNNKMLEVNSDKKALALIEQVKEKLGAKPLAVLLKGMLQVDPMERVTAKQALAMLPGLAKVALPTTGPIIDMAKVAQGLAPVAKAGKKDLTATRACDILECTHPMTRKAAELFWRRSPAARDLGAVGAATCAMLAAKQYETDPYHAEEVWLGYKGLGDYDGDAFAQGELAVLKDLSYCLAV